MHWPAIADIDGLGPYFSPADVVHAGCRDDDDALAETRGLLGAVIPASEIIAGGVAAAAAAVHEVVATGYWLHLDVDVLDPSVMPAVDSADPGGLDPDQLTELLATLAPAAVGAQVTVFDPDLDPDGRQARLLSDIVCRGLSGLGAGLP